MGSVKDIIVYQEPSESSLGRGDFIFSDRFSVFDWGEMPDTIPNKGSALCLMAAWNFEKINEYGFTSHYLGVINSDDEKMNIKELEYPTNKMEVSLSQVIKPEFINGCFDYSYFDYNRGKINNFVVPLEVIYRNGILKGSSLFKTIEDLEKEGNKTELYKLLSNYGLAIKPKPGDLMPKVGYDFTTKFEPFDRKIDEEEAFRISGLTENQFTKLKEIRKAAVNLVSERAKEVGMIDYDGKHEYRFFNGDVEIADVFGTLDENRFMYNGRQVSKEFLRQIYRKEQNEWVEDIMRAKIESKEKGIENWKTLVKTKPNKLDPKLISLIGEMYTSAAQRYTGVNFKSRELHEVMRDLDPYYEFS